MRTEFFIVISVLGWGIGSFLYKFATNDSIHPIMISTISLSLYIVLMSLAWSFVKFDHTINLHGIIFTLFSALFMCIGTLGFSYALRSGGDVGLTSILTALYPTLTVALSCLFLGESFTLKKGIGMIFAVISFVILAQK